VALFRRLDVHAHLDVLEPQAIAGVPLDLHAVGGIREQRDVCVSHREGLRPRNALMQVARQEQVVPVSVQLYAVPEVPSGASSASDGSPPCAVHRASVDVELACGYRSSTSAQSKNWATASSASPHCPAVSPQRFATSSVRARFSRRAAVPYRLAVSAVVRRWSTSTRAALSVALAHLLSTIRCGSFRMYATAAMLHVLSRFEFFDKLSAVCCPCLSSTADMKVLSFGCLARSSAQVAISVRPAIRRSFSMLIGSRLE
jgi:hypothetical protein